MTGRDTRPNQLRYLFRKQGGKCHICGEPAVLDGNGGKVADGLSAVRFRLGSSYGKPGRIRKRVMAHRKCAQERSDQITASVPVEELWARSKSFPTEFYCAPDKPDDELTR